MLVTTKPTKQEFFEEIRARPHIQKLQRGDYRPESWFTAAPGTEDWGSWGVRAKPGRRGLTLMDANAAAAGEVPEVAPPVNVARGGAWRSEAPPYPWAVNEKYLVWSENVATLFEEGVSRQWSATSDIPWQRLEPLPPDLERAYCQFLTHLVTTEYGVNDSLGQWIGRINTTFHEVKFFITQQMNDEVRHSEVFRKRALAGGGGLGVSNAFVPNQPLGGHSSPIRQAMNGNFSHLSYFVQVLGEGVFLDNFRFGEFLARTEVDKEIFRRVMQDEARHVSYGVMRLKYYLEHHPDRAAALADMHDLADEAEIFLQGTSSFNPQFLEPLAIMAGGDVERMEEGMEIYRNVWARIVEEYLKRCELAGLPRRGRTYMLEEPPF
jgi:hypothetical protein